MASVAPQQRAQAKQQKRSHVVNALKLTGGAGGAYAAYDLARRLHAVDAKLDQVMTLLNIKMPPDGRAVSTGEAPSPDITTDALVSTAS